MWVLFVAISAATFTACGSAGQRWSNGDFSVVLPSGWNPEDSAGDGFTVVRAPTGPGRLAFVEIVNRSPEPVTRDSALADGLPGIESAGLPTAGLQAVAVGTDHYVINAAGSSRGERVVAAVHVFAGGVILIGYYHSADESDPHLGAAATILASLMPE